MSEYEGKIRHARVKIKKTSRHWSRYADQECDAIIYDPPVMPQINSEQLKPPVPKWQSIPLSDVDIL